ncbi:MAG: hypothetical protein ACKN9U_11330, partial [Pirellulaceae bacterium]
SLAGRLLNVPQFMMSCRFAMRWTRMRIAVAKPIENGSCRCSPRLIQRTKGASEDRTQNECEYRDAEDEYGPSAEP